MRDLARAYRALVKAAWGMTLEYRAQAILWFVAGIFPLVMMVVWLAILDEAGPLAGWNRDDFLAYYVGMVMVDLLTGAWVNWDWDEDIRTGNLSVKLLKPIDPFHQLLSQELGWKIFIVLFIAPVVAVVAWLSPEIHYPLTIGRVTAFVLSIIAGYTVNLLMASAFGVLAFWSTQVRNLFSLWFGAGRFLSGFIAPLALFPEAFRGVAYVLPFRSSISFPMEVLMGRVDGPGMLFGFAVTAAWIVIFVVAYRLLWRFGLRRYEAVGA